MKDRMVVVLFAIACVAALACIWILMGHNHHSFMIVVGAIGTLTGYAFGAMKECKT